MDDENDPDRLARRRRRYRAVLFLLLGAAVTMGGALGGPTGVLIFGIAWLIVAASYADPG